MMFNENVLNLGLQLVSRYPNNPDGYIITARYYLQDRTEITNVKSGLPYVKRAAEMTKNTEYYFNYSIASRWVKEYEKAIWGINIVLEKFPNNPQYIGHKGYVLYSKGDHEEGINHLKKAIAIVENTKPSEKKKWSTDERNCFVDFIKVICEYYLCMPEHINEATRMATFALEEFKDLPEDKLFLLKKFLDYNYSIETTNVAGFGKNQVGEMYFLAGHQYQEQGDLVKASTEFMYACEYLPHLALPYYAASMTLRFIGQHEMALKYINNAVKIDSTNMMFLSNLMHLLKATCRWKEFDEKMDIIYNLINEKNYDDLVEFRLSGVYWGFGMKLMHKLSSDYSKTLEVSQKKQCKHGKKQILNKKLKIAYVSSNYRNHAQGSQLASFFKEHDRNEFEVYAISIFPALVDMAIERRDMLKLQVDHWIDAHEMDPEDIAKMIKKNNIDILIDLNGHADHPKLELYAYRPAPIQISFLGYPGTTGAKFMDYYVGDSISTPIKTMEKHFSEKLFIMPHTYQLTEHKGQYSPETFINNDLKDDKIVFCNYNQPIKIEHKIFSSWMNILKGVENSVLWLLDHTATDKMKEEATKQGIDQTRLIFQKQVDKTEHLKRLQHADLLLDTTIYNAHTSAGDALWAGCPILTILGDTMPARVCASMVTSALCPEMIVNSIGEYEARAIYLGNNIGLLKDMRTKVETSRNDMPLFDTNEFVKDMEKGYKHVWSEFVKNGLGKCESFCVADL